MIMNKTTQNNEIELDPNTATIADIRRTGMRVRVAHQRLAFNNQIDFATPLLMPQWLVKRNKNWTILGTGGVTTVQVTDKEGFTGEGTAICVDSFERKVGLNISLRRAIQDLNSQKDMDYLNKIGE